MWFAAFWEHEASSAKRAFDKVSGGFAPRVSVSACAGVTWQMPSVDEGTCVRLGVGSGADASALGCDAWARATARGLDVSRGSAGGRPIYVAQLEGGAVASTSIELLRTVLPASELNPRYFAARVAWVFGARPREALYHGVTALAPRDLLHIDHVGLRWRRRQLPAEVGAGLGGLSAEEYLWGQVCAAVGRSLQRVARPAWMVSGGIDSSGVLAAGRDCGRLQDGVCFPHWRFDGPCPDAPYAQAVAAHVGVQLRMCDASAWPGLLAESLSLGGGPYSMPAGVMEREGMRAAKLAGADALLTGMGGDETLGGVPQSLMRDTELGVWSRLAQISRLQMSWPTTPTGRLMHYALRPTLRPLAPSWLRMRMRRAGEANDMPWAGALLHDYVNACTADTRAFDHDLSTPAGRYARVAEAPGLAPLAELRAQLEQDTGLQRLDPLLDDGVIAAVANLPPHVVYADDRHRGAFRRALAGRMPRRVVERRDKAYFEHAFGRMWIGARQQEIFLEVARGERLAALGVVAPAAFQEATRVLWSVDDPFELGTLMGPLWPALSAEKFLMDHADA